MTRQSARRLPHLLALTLMLLTLLALPISGAGVVPARAQATSQTFPETGKTVSGKFLDYWNKHGGLPQQGFPISEEMQEKSDTNGKTYTVQYFERAVFELHPENQPPNDVLLSLLGSFRYKDKYSAAPPTDTANTSPGTMSFSQTGKHLGGGFLAYWQSHGGLAQQGFPISEEFNEISDLDGKSYHVQYFERAVFEFHPENPASSNILLSQLGTFHYKTQVAIGWVAPPNQVPPALATQVPTPTQVPVPPTRVPVAPTPIPASKAPADAKGFAKFILSKYGQIGPCVLDLDDTYTDDTSVHAVSLKVASGVYTCLADRAGKAAVKAWGDAVQAEADAVWSKDDYLISLELAGYTYDPCLDCGTKCYYVSDTYTSGEGWYEVFTLVGISKFSGHESVNVCLVK